MRIVGIDGGLDGGLTLLVEGKVVEREVMPAVGDGKRDLDLNRIVWLLEQWAPDHVVFELAHPMPRQGASSTFTIGRCFGMVQGVLAALALPTTLVRARDWQRELFAGLPFHGDTKRASVQTAGRLWPAVNWRASERCRVAHDGLTDSALIAEWGRRHLSPHGQSWEIPQPG